MDIQFSYASGLHDSIFGKALEPIRSIILAESDALDKRLGLVDSLFNVEKSSHFAEGYEVRAGLEEFMAVPDGGEPVNDGTESTGKKVIENIQFLKSTVITRSALEDAKMKITPEMKRKIEGFVGVYYRTRNHIASAALANAEQKAVRINGADVDLTTFDGLPLFHKAHKWGGKKKSGNQCNLFYLADGADAIKSVEYLEDVINTASFKLINMKDENGNAMGYEADTIRVPGNRKHLAMYLRKLLGSEYAGSIENATMNTQNGKYNLFIDPFWQSDKDVIDVMSKESSRLISGNVFQNRSKLTVTAREDRGLNLEQIARCRFGVGFPEYKHIERIYLLDKDATMATAERLD